MTLKVVQLKHFYSMKSLFDEFPTIASEWDYKKNIGLDPKDIHSGSSKIVYWQCAEGHNWKARISHRTRNKSNCPYCWGRYASKENNFEKVYPDLAKTWHPTKNGNILPKDVTPKSGTKRYWICKDCGEELFVAPHLRSRNVCGYCSGRYATDKNCIKLNAPHLIKEWHPTKNGNNTPINTSISSGKKIHWICKQGHEWKEFPYNRKKGSQCPYCMGKRATSSYNLKTKYPKIALKWHPTKNLSITPNEVTPKSSKSVWWICDKCGHEWKRKISGMTDKIGNETLCPKCNIRNQTSKDEIRILSELSSIFKNIKHREKISRMEIDIYIPDYKFGIEIDGGYWHKDKYEKDLEKNQKLKNYNISIFRLRGKGLGVINNVNDVLYNTKILKTNINELFQKIKNNILLINEDVKNINNYISKKRFTNVSIYNSLIENIGFTQLKKSLYYLEPKLLSEWDYEKNGNISPKTISIKSGEKIWWKCSKCNHSWKTAVSHRTKNGTGCKICSRKEQSGRYPRIGIQYFKEYALSKGGICLSEKYKNLNTELEFKCKEGHIWKATGRNIRHKNSWCPMCYKEGRKKLKNEINR